MLKPKHSLSNYLHLAVMFMLPVQLFILMPAVVYLTNINEMTVGLFPILRICIVPCFLSVLVLFVIYKCCRRAFRIYWLMLIATATFLLWLQGNIILWDYGVLDGRSINWLEYRWRGWVDAFVWLVVIIVVITFLRSRPQLVFGLGIMVVMMQAVYVLILLPGYFSDDSLQHTYNDLYDLKKIYTFSKKQNVLHIIVDGFQADVFDFLINHEDLGENYRQVFSGFTYYKENLGVFASTQLSVPALLSGQVYKNQSIKDDFIKQVLTGKNILNQAKNQGFELDIAGPGGYMSKKYAYTDYDHIYDLDHDASVDPLHQKSAKLIDISLFRSLPHFLKPHIYSNQNWLLSKMVAGKVARKLGMLINFRYFNHAAFLNYFTENMQVGRDKPVYKFLHIMNTHPPIVVNQACQFIGGAGLYTKETLTYQTKCTLDILADFLEKLKEIDVFDSSFIIIHADHGSRQHNYRQGPDIEIPNDVALNYLQGFVDIEIPNDVAPNYRQGPYIKLPNGDILNYRQGPIDLPNDVALFLPRSAKSLASPLLLIKKPGISGNLEVSEQLTSLLQLPDTIADVLFWDHNYGHSSIFDENQQPDVRKFYHFKFIPAHWKTKYAPPILVFDIFGSHYEAEWKLSEVYTAPP